MSCFRLANLCLYTVEILEMKLQYTCEPCHGRMCLRSFVVVIGPTNPSLGMTSTVKLYSAAFTDYILYVVGVIPKAGLPLLLI